VSRRRDPVATSTMWPEAGERRPGHPGCADKRRAPAGAGAL